MVDNHISHLRSLSSDIAKQNDYVRELLERAAEVLRLPAPDTFLGRKTQEPFPWQLKQ